ncbi:MAG: LysE type translocator [Methanomethylovorans sp. PtaU1.Bin093]|uniref:LysE family transporter n=1 Tax=Methanomethylovorans sp. PtaU1.Bin093 TaxID=1811679 RepID=UPI0009C8C63C|nr:LysE family transporter [Methanomethylovorans sp. PtaU1.Bin093]OPY19360.1 MAG: LysE type translocator [Methanomethylovorans sp. PtaU1.Bin093]
MFELIEMLTIGFAVGMSGALVPGPMLFATIDGSMKTGWTSGPKVVLGHALLELAICILMVLGMPSLGGERAISAVSLIGGAVLILFGILAIKDARSAASSIGGDINYISANPVVAGIITSVSNPYFWIWWFAAGSALVLKGLEISLLAAALFIFGHWVADLSWFSIVSVSFSKGKRLMSSRAYENVLLSCGIFLILFGSWFAIGVLL